MLILICGLPNAGKTTYSEQYSNVLHLDEIGSTLKVAEYITHINNDDIVIEGIFNTPESRERIIKAYNGKKTKCIFLDTPFEEILCRENRGRPKWLLQNAAKVFIPPTYEEGWDEIEVIVNGR